jgi:hypothetical protein
MPLSYSAARPCLSSSFTQEDDNLVLLDTLYWLVLGIAPGDFLFYHFAMEIDYLGDHPDHAKQSINGPSTPSLRASSITSTGGSRAGSARIQTLPRTPFRSRSSISPLLCALSCNSCHDREQPATNWSKIEEEIKQRLQNVSSLTAQVLEFLV